MASGPRLPKGRVPVTVTGTRPGGPVRTVPPAVAGQRFLVRLLRVGAPSGFAREGCTRFGSPGIFGN